MLSSTQETQLIPQVNSLLFKLQQACEGKKFHFILDFPIKSRHLSQPHRETERVDQEESLSDHRPHKNKKGSMMNSNKSPHTETEIIHQHQT
jgi:hypothetical protein